MKFTERSLQWFLLFGFILYFQFYHLSSLPYRIWDEARLATNAYEMSKTGNLVVTTVNFQPDMWNTKPPLMIWAQAACIKLHGLTEFSVRFPAAFSASLTAIILFVFITFVTKNGWAGLLAGIVLCTSRGYLDYHGSRYGEFDSMLTLFTTTYLILFFLYTESKGTKKDSYLLLFFAALAGGVLTKSVAALLFSPALLLYLIFRQQFLETVTNRFFYIGLVGFITVVLGYYLLREHYNPGYIQAVYENELGGRFLKTNEEHKGPFNYYITHYRTERFSNWIWGLYAAVGLLLFNSRKKNFRLSLFILLCVSVFVIVISTSQTKLAWYDLPTYPLFAIILSLLILQVSEIISGTFSFLRKKIVFLLLVIIFSAQPTYEAFQMVRYAGDSPDDNLYAFSNFLRDAIWNNKDLKDYKYISQTYALQWHLYINRLNDVRNLNFDYENFSGKNIFKVGQRIILNEDITREYLETHYNYKLIEESRNIRLYEILNTKITE
ncbi:MAG: glycosyltransferase family 39 protein [Chitinophagales bacterium]